MEGEKVKAAIDRLRQLIKNVKAKGQFTNAKVYENYLDKIMKNPKIKNLYKDENTH